MGDSEAVNVDVACSAMRLCEKSLPMQRGPATQFSSRVRHVYFMILQ